MKKTLLLVSLLIFTATLFSQEYYTDKWERCHPSVAMYALFRPDSDTSQLYPVKIMAKGKFTGTEGFFATNDKRSGNLIIFGKETTKMLYNAFYVNGLRHGPTRLFRVDGTVLGVQQYIAGKRQGLSEYFFRSGKRSAAIEYDNDKIIKENYWDEDGSVVTDKSRIKQEPLFKGKPVESSFAYWVSRRLRYPENCRDSRIEGVVKLSFTITEEGRLIDINVISSPHPDLSAEAVSVVSNSPLWSPARMYNQTASVVYVFPITFKLRESYRSIY